jgi:hypothetical protein
LPHRDAGWAHLPLSLLRPTRYSYHSCRNRHCPTCQQDAAQAWLVRQQDLLLPVPYFLVTFTLPGGLRDVAYRHQTLIYDLFFRSSAAALQQLAQDPRFLGGQLGMVGVLQTWTRDLRYHPHIHYLVPGGGLASDGRTWVTAKADFLVHVKPLAILFRAKLRAALRQTKVWASIPAEIWRQDWVVDCRPVRSGRTALKYLAPYIFRVALNNNLLLSMQDGQITFRYQDGATHQTKSCTLPAEAFIQRFLAHILPKGFVKVRYYGLFRVGQRQKLARLRAQLVLQQRQTELLTPPDEPRVAVATLGLSAQVVVRRCGWSVFCLPSAHLPLAVSTPEATPVCSQNLVPRLGPVSGCPSRAQQPPEQNLIVPAPALSRGRRAW